MSVIYADDQRKPDVARQEVDALLKKAPRKLCRWNHRSNILAAVQKPVVRSKPDFRNAGWSGMAANGPIFHFLNNDQTQRQWETPAGRIHRQCLLR